MNKFFDEFDSNYSYFGKVPGYQKVAIVQPECAICPADEINKDKLSSIVAIQPVTDAKNATDDFAVLSESDMAKGDFKDSWKFKKPVGRTNYLGCAGAYSGGRHTNAKYWPYEGMMTSRGRMRLEAVSNRDGTANTIMFGESIGGIKDGKRTVAQAWFTSACGRGRGHIGFGKKVTEKTGPILGNEKNASVFGFGSKHPVGVNFANGDAAVISLKRNIDSHVFQAMTGYRDGVVFDVSKYSVPVRDFKVRAIMRAYREKNGELERARIEIEVAKDRELVKLRNGLREIAAFNLKKKNDTEVARAYKEILKLDPSDEQARKYFKSKGELESLLKNLKENGYPKKPFPKNLNVKSSSRPKKIRTKSERGKPSSRSKKVRVKGKRG